jgi:hypothetical protein
MDQVESLTAQVKKENRKYFRKVRVGVVKSLFSAEFFLQRLKVILLTSMGNNNRSKS